MNGLITILLNFREIWLNCVSKDMMMAGAISDGQISPRDTVTRRVRISRQGPKYALD